jgi:hypothetical protein
MRRSAEWLGSKPSSVMVRGSPCYLRPLRKNALAAVLSRVRLRCEATVRPSSSTARYRYIQRPPTLIYVSSQRQDRPSGRSKWTPKSTKIFRVPYHPTQDRARSHQDAQFLCDFSHIPIAEFELKVPPHRQNNLVSQTSKRE